MAAFNPQVEDVGTQRYIGYSERSRGENVWGTLFEGLVGAADTSVKASLQNDVNSAVKKADQDFFGLDTVTNEQKDNEAKGQPDAPLPGPVKEGGEKINSLARARENGSLSTTNYWAHLNSVVSELKSKWPGYSTEIDKYVSTAINSPTADQLRSSIIADQNAKTSSVAAKQKADEEFIKQNVQYLNSSQQEAWANGTLTANDIAEIKITVGRARAQKEESDHLKTEYEIASAKRAESKDNLTFAQDKAFMYGNAKIRGIFSDAIYSAVGSTNKSFQEFQTMLTEAKKDGVTPEELQKIAPMAEKIRTTLLEQKNDLYNKPDANGVRLVDVMRPDDMKKLDDAFDAQMSIINDALGGKPEALGLLNFNAAIIKAGNESRTIAVLGTTEGQLVADLRALNDASGGLLTTSIQDQLVRDTGAGTSPITQAIAGYLVGGGLKEGKAMYDMMAKSNGAGTPKERAAAVSAGMGVLVDTITKPGFTAEQKKKAITSLFGSRNVEFLDSIDDTIGKDGFSSRQRTFLRLATPEVAKAIAEQGPDALKNYNDWILSSGPKMFNNFAKGMQDTVEWNKYAKLGFDGKQFTIDVDESKFKDPQAAKDWLMGGKLVAGGRGGSVRSNDLGDMVELGKYKDGVEAVKAVNVFLRGYIPALEAAGVTDKEMQGKMIMQALSVNLQAEKQLPLLDRLGNTIKYMFSRPERAPKQGENDLKTTEPNGPVAATPGSNDSEESTGGKTQVIMDNKGASRNLDLTPTLKDKLSKAATDVLGEGVVVKVFSGGQHADDPDHVGSNRHDEGRAGDVRFYLPNGKQIVDKEKLDKIKEYWLANKFGSVGTYMKGMGMHLDELTEDKLGPGQGLTWNY